MKPVRVQVQSFLTCPANVAWKHLILMDSCDQWMSVEEWSGLALLQENGGYAGFRVGPLRDGIEPLVSLVERMVVGESVSYAPVVADGSNVPRNARAAFPFRRMTQSVRLRNTRGGCEVVHELEWVPKGLLGWIACTFVLAPSVKRGLIDSNLRLAGFLASSQRPG
jgi:hypothetical protein